MKPVLTLGIALAATGLLGCGGGKPYDIVEVTGQILLDGQPLPNAHVVFRPVAKEGQEEVGPDAVGTTDVEGRFTLRTVFDEDGATVGRNTVSVSTLELLENPSDPDNVRARQVVSPEKVPPRYNLQTELFYDVREGGDSNASIKLQSK
jgi:hypothetical protein